MQLTAKLIQQLPVQSGLSINGPWVKQNIIVETTGDYPKMVCISIWNGRLDISKLEIGKEYIFHCNIESKEYKGKWYTEVTLWKIDEADLFEDEDEDDVFQIPEQSEDNEIAFNEDNEEKRGGSGISERRTLKPGILEKIRNASKKLPIGDLSTTETPNPPSMEDFDDTEHKNRKQQDTLKKSFREQLEEFEAIEKNQPAKIAGSEAKRPSDQKTKNTGETRVDPNVPPGLEEMFLKYFNEDATFTGEVTEISDVEADPDEENIIMSGNASNMPDRFKINVDEVALPSEKVPIDDVSFTDKNSTENNTGNIKPHGKLKIDLKKLKSTRKLRGKNDLNDPDFSL